MTLKINQLKFVCHPNCGQGLTLKIVPSSAHTQHLCILYGSRKKRRLFPCTALTDYLTEMQCVYCAVRSKSLSRGKINLSFESVVLLTSDFTGQTSTKNLSDLLEKPPDLQYKKVSVISSVDIKHYILDNNCSYLCQIWCVFRYYIESNPIKHSHYFMYNLL